MASFSEFPELGSNPSKKTVFQGVSLASKLKDVIAAEEEAAIQKRLKKGDTPEMILREACVALPLKSSFRTHSQILEVPEWITDSSIPMTFPAFRHKTLEQLAQERQWKRLGISGPLLSFDLPQEEVFQDTVSLPDLTAPDSEEEEEEEILQEIPA